MLAEAQIEKISAVLLNQPNVQFAYLFGSQATGKISPMSDVDFALGFNDELSAWDRLQSRVRVMALFSEVLQRNDIDVADLNEADEVLRYQVLRHGRLIFCREKAEQVEFFVRTLREYFDTEPLREIFLESMKEQIREGNFVGRSQRYAKAAEEAARVFGAFKADQTKLQSWVYC